jgi:threonine dehydrogenase-like Zn-dependent dehydrogenase
LIGPEVLDADDGAYVIPVKDEIGFAETALTEPWACVDAAYTQRRRLSPKTGGTMWILGNPGDKQKYRFSNNLPAPRKIILTDIPDQLKTLINNDMPDATEIIEVNNLQTDDLSGFAEEHTGGKGFDDIILLAPTSAELVSGAVELISFRGTFNIVSRRPLDGEVRIDAGRLHYHYTSFVGNSSPEISASYGEAHNRCKLRAGGTAVFIGAGGPMGQMHVQRAIEVQNGPDLIIATEINEHRLAVLDKIIKPLAEARGKRFAVFNPEKADETLQTFITRLNNGKLADDVVVCVPVAPLMESSAKLLNADGMLVFFAGVPVGTNINMKLDALFLNNLQLTGTSGSRLSDQKMILEKTLRGELNPNRSVAAIGGIEAAQEGLEAMMSGKFAGKIIIFPQVSGLPLIGLEELKDRFPKIGEKLGENNLWTIEAEKALIENYWCGENK